MCPSGANAAGFATNSLLWGCACPIWLKKALPHVLMGPCAGDVLPEVNGSWQFIAPQPGIMLISAVLLCAGGFVSLCCGFFLFFYFFFISAELEVFVSTVRMGACYLLLSSLKSCWGQ